MRRTPVSVTLVLGMPLLVFEGQNQEEYSRRLNELTALRRDGRVSYDPVT